MRSRAKGEWRRDRLSARWPFLVARMSSMRAGDRVPAAGRRRPRRRLARAGSRRRKDRARTGLTAPSAPCAPLSVTGRTRPETGMNIMREATFPATKMSGPEPVRAEAARGGSGQPLESAFSNSESPESQRLRKTNQSFSNRYQGAGETHRADATFGSARQPMPPQRFPGIAQAGQARCEKPKRALSKVPDRALVARGT